jgi:hypothetical protein
MNWIDAINIETNEKIREAGKHVVVVPAQNSSAPIDTYDVFDGNTFQFVATAVSEKTAKDFAVIWNSLIDDGESVENIRRINLGWLTGVK